jgi:hypothetical protein
MPASSLLGPSLKRTEQLIAPIPIGGHTFDFHLCARPISLGPVAVHYYWMDVTYLRSVKDIIGETNFRSCTGHWMHAMQASGAMDDAQRAHFVTAMLYLVFCRSKSLQKIYSDAILRPVRRGAELNVELPDETRIRIKRLIRPRNRNRIGQEFDEIFGRFYPPEDKRRQLDKAFNRLIGLGVEKLKNDAFEAYLEFMESETADARKRGGHEFDRMFINMLGYQAKVAFYLCYANAWIDIIKWLKENRGLDKFSERFLRFWHCQNQPPEGADGTIHRDVFSGQVLALHPLSGFFMRDAALCEVAGRYFGSDEFDQVARTGNADKCKTYWNLVGAILDAAHQYRIARDQQANSRGGRGHSVELSEPMLNTVSAREESSADLGRLEEFAKYKQLRCACGNTLKVLKVYPAKSNAKWFKLDFTCAKCKLPTSKRFGREELTMWLKSDGQDEPSGRD